VLQQRVALGGAVLENPTFPLHANLRRICEEKVHLSSFFLKLSTDPSQIGPAWVLEIRDIAGPPL
jgi:hypothetical protein